MTTRMPTTTRRRAPPWPSARARSRRSRRRGVRRGRPPALRRARGRRAVVLSMSGTVAAGVGVEHEVRVGADEPNRPRLLKRAVLVPDSQTRDSRSWQTPRFRPTPAWATPLGLRSRVPAWQSTRAREPPSDVSRMAPIRRAVRIGLRAEVSGWHPAGAIVRCDSVRMSLRGLARAYIRVGRRS
jgi:hypothetical protein